MPAIKVKINKKGEIDMDYKGFAGKNCDIAEAKIKKALDEINLKNKNQRYKDMALEEEREHA
jgi:hypothetical protein